MRLIGDPIKKAVVEVYDGISRWGRICPDEWALEHAQFVCKHFGYRTALGAIEIRSDDITYLSNGSTIENMIEVTSRCHSDSTTNSFVDSCTRTAISIECECSQLNAGVICGTGI